MTTNPTTKAPAKVSPVPLTGEARTKALAEARTEAVGQIIDKHRSEFNDLMEAAARRRNAEWKRKPTEDEKRRAKLQALIDEDPTLAEYARDLADNKKITGITA